MHTSHNTVQLQLDTLSRKPVLRDQSTPVVHISVQNGCSVVSVTDTSTQSPVS